MVLDDDQVNELNQRINDRFTAEEVCEILGLTVTQLLDKFQDEVLEVDWETLV